MQCVLRDIRQPEHILLGPLPKTQMIEALLQKGPLHDAQLFRWIAPTDKAHDRAYQRFRRGYQMDGFSEDDCNRAADIEFRECYGIDPYDFTPSPDTDVPKLKARKNKGC